MDSLYLRRRETVCALFLFTLKGNSIRTAVSGTRRSASPSSAFKMALLILKDNPI
jgi:hypothetical protein